MSKSGVIFAKFAVTFANNHKILPLSDAAFRCLVEATLWSREQLTDGFLPSRLARARWSLEVLRELCANDPDSPSLIEVENGFLIHDYDAYQDTRADVEARREHAIAAGRKGGRAKSKHLAKQSAKQGAKQSPSRVSSKNVAEEEVDITTSRPRLDEAEPDRLDVKRIVSTLVELLQGRGVKVPKSLRQWEVSARLLLDADGRPLEEILAVLEWSQRDEFWSKNVLSLPKFREKYDQLRLKADIKPSVQPEDFVRECWKNATIAPITELCGRKPDCVRWPDPEPPDFDKDEFLRDFRRQWIADNREDLVAALRGRL